MLVALPFQIHRPMSDPQPRNPYEVSAALENVGRMVARCREHCWQIMGTSVPPPIRSVGVVGAGIMGAAIAVELALRSIPVVLVDTSADALRQAAAMAGSELAAGSWRNAPIPAAQRIVYSLDAADLAGYDLVLESISEKRPAKQDLYAKIRPHLSGHTILATNTSTIPIARLAMGVAEPNRFCGLHFCHPVRLRPLVEVIPGPATSKETSATVVAHVLSLGKLPLVVEDGPGFVVNRLLMTYLNAALEMALAGVSIQQIDRAMAEFGMPLGPLQLLDEIGLDTALHSGIVLGEIFGGRSGGSELLLRLVKSGQLGVKSWAGFYQYPERTPNPSCGYIVHALQCSDTFDEKTPSNGVQIAERLLLPMVAEAARMLRENKVAAGWQIDLAMIFGIGFPIWRGGPLWWASQSEKRKTYWAELFSGDNLQYADQ